MAHQSVLGSVAFNAAGTFAGVDFSVDGRSLVALVPNRQSTILHGFDVDTGVLTSTLELAEEWSAVRAVDDGFIVWLGARVMRVNTKGAPMWSLAPVEEATYLTGVCVSIDGAYVVTYGSGQVARLYNGRTGQLVHTLQEASDDVCTAAVSADGAYTATATLKGIVRVWRNDSGVELASRKSTKVLSLAFSLDGESLLGGHGNGDVKRWSLPALRPGKWESSSRHTFSDDARAPAGVRFLAWMPAGASTHAWSYGNDLTLRSWSGGYEVKRIDVPWRHGQAPSIALSRDGSLIACGSTSGALSVWRTASAEALVHDAAPTRPTGLALLPGVVVESSHGPFVAWDRKTGASHTRKLGCPPADVAVRADGRLLLLDYDRVSVLTALDDPAPVRLTLKASASGRMAPAHTSVRVAVPAGDELEVWDTDSAVRVASFAPGHRVQAAAYSPDDTWLVTVGAELCVWRGDDVAKPTLRVDFGAGICAEIHGVCVSARGVIVVSRDTDNSIFNTSSALVVIDGTTGAITATLDAPGVRLGRVLFLDDTRVAVADSAGGVRVADVVTGRYLDPLVASSDVACELEGLPLARSDGELAHIRGDRNIGIVRIP